MIQRGKDIHSWLAIYEPSNLKFEQLAISNTFSRTCSFPSAFFMNRMEEVFTVIKKAVPKDSMTCENCQKMVSDSFCHSCQQCICAECVRAHKQLQFLSSHEIVSIDSLRSSLSSGSPEKIKVAHRDLKCSKHTDESLKLYCHDCHKLVCRDCTLIDHKDHGYVFVVDAAPLCKAEMREMSESVKKISDDLKAAVKSLEDSKKKLSDHETATTRAIDDAINRISAKLMQKKAEMKAKASEMVSEVKEKVSVQEKNAELAVGEVESLLEFMNHSLETATDQELLSLEKQMSDEVDRVSNLYKDPAGKFPVPEVPELAVQCGPGVEQAIKSEMSVVNRPGDKGSGATHAGLKSPSPTATDDTPTEQRQNVFTGFHPNILALMQRLPEGDIHGVEYHIREGSVHITLEDKGEIQEAISKFQDAFQKIVGPGQGLRVEQVTIPASCSVRAVKSEIAKFEQQYLHTAFVLEEEKRVIRVISQSRQFEQAKMSLEDALQKISASSPLGDPVVVKCGQSRTLTLKRGDIAQEKADILVNAANSCLQHGGGVAGALNAASEGQLQTFSDKYMEKKRKGKEIPTGEVAVTHGGGRLQCTHVVHAVGPDGFVHSTVQCERLLKQVIQNTLIAAEVRNATSIAIPAISSGIYGVSKDLVAHCIIDTILGFHFTKPAPVLSDIRIVILDQPTHSQFAHYLQQKGLVSRRGSQGNIILK